MPDKLVPAQAGNIPQPPAAAGQAGMMVELSKVLHYFVYRVLISSRRKNHPVVQTNTSPAYHILGTQP
jgi:hypothetical protein